MTNQLLILFAIFADHAGKAPAGILKQADTAMAVFSFFLFLVYAGFTMMLAAFRGDIIKEGTLIFVFSSFGVFLKRFIAVESSLGVNEEDYAARDAPPENI